MGAGLEGSQEGREGRRQERLSYQGQELLNLRCATRGRCVSCSLCLPLIICTMGPITCRGVKIGDDVSGGLVQ